MLYKTTISTLTSLQVESRMFFLSFSFSSFFFFFFPFSFFSLYTPHPSLSFNLMIQETLFSSMFSGRFELDIEKPIFIDRDGKNFVKFFNFFIIFCIFFQINFFIQPYILNFMRDLVYSSLSLLISLLLLFSQSVSLPNDILCLQQLLAEANYYLLTRLSTQIRKKMKEINK